MHSLKCSLIHFVSCKYLVHTFSVLGALLSIREIALKEKWSLTLKCFDVGDSDTVVCRRAHGGDS